MGDAGDVRRLQAEEERDRALEELRRRTEELEDSHRRYRRIFERTKDVIIVSTPDGRLVEINPAGLALYDYPSIEAIRSIDLGKEMWADPADRDEYIRQLREFGSVKEFEANHQTRTGRIITVLGTTSVVKGESGEIVELLTILRDISEQKRLSRELERLARTDSLTGLANRVVFRERLELAVAEWRRDRAGFALMILDVDNLKQINDSLGHPAGDAVLTGVAERFQSVIREVDLLARVGGDEFALILSGTSDKALVRATMERLVASLSAPIAFADHEIATTVSIGATIPAAKAPTSDQLLQRADRALYRAKGRGRNQGSC